MRGAKIAALALCGSITACGGGGSGGGAITTLPVANTPTPSPSPSPTPTPSPPPDYSEFDFSRTFLVQADSAADLRVHDFCPPTAPPCTYDTGSVVLDDRPAATFGWNPQSADFTITGQATELFLGSEKLPNVPAGNYPLLYTRLVKTLPPAEWRETQTTARLFHVWQEKQFHLVDIEQSDFVRN